MKKVALFKLLLLLSFAVQSASEILYFPADYDGTVSPDNVTNQGEFAPICEVPGDIYSVRLEGLDMVRGFASAATCAVTSVSNSFAEEVEYIFLIDDTEELSNYLKTQMRGINVLQNIGGREVIRPSVVDMSAGNISQGLKILVVGEMAFTNSSDDENGWFTTVNNRFAEDQVVAVGGNSGSGSGPAAPPPLPSRPLNDYMTECHNTHLVPLPPVWNPTSGVNQWTRRGELVTPFSQGALYPKVQVWTYESTSPQGVCYALPRMNSGGDINTDIELLGIICQSEQTGKACFWDNVERPTGAPSRGETDEAIRRPGTVEGIRIRGLATRGLDPVNMRDGYNLKENCTECHRGSNVFLVQKGTALDGASVRLPNGTVTQALDIDPAVRYQPVSGTPPSPSWQNPVSTVQPLIDSVVSGSQCSGCHSINGNNNFDNEIPEFTFDYCDTIVKKSIGTNMPPRPAYNPADWATTHLEEVQVISNECCSLGVDLGLQDNAGNNLNTTTCTGP